MIADTLDYNPQTGAFKWKRRRTQAGCVNTAGYLVIRIKKTLHYAHRLAWFLHYGTWPEREIDHINRDKSDNRISNLRLATSTQNKVNCGMRSHNTSGYKGVFWSKQKARWQARATRHKKQFHLGFWDTAQQAGEAYYQWALSHDSERN